MTSMDDLWKGEAVRGLWEVDKVSGLGQEDLPSLCS